MSLDDVLRRHFLKKQAKLTIGWKIAGKIQNFKKKNLLSKFGLIITHLVMETEFKNISIRTNLRCGDIGFIIYLHGSLYQKEYNYSIAFESDVAKGPYKFYNQYDPSKDCVWICEHNHSIIGFLLLMHRENRVSGVPGKIFNSI